MLREFEDQENLMAELDEQVRTTPTNFVFVLFFNSFVIFWAKT